MTKLRKRNDVKRRVSPGNFKIKTKLLSGILVIILLVGLSGCFPKVSPTPDPQEPATEATESTQDNTDNTDNAQPSEVKQDPVSLGDVVDAAKSTKENPVPFGTWASVTVSDGGWPKPAYARISSVITDQTQVQILIDEYNDKNSSNMIPGLEEHAEFLDYVVAEYEVNFPADFSDSNQITFFGLVFSRESNQGDWIASDGSNYYWMGSVIAIDVPSMETESHQNGDTVTGRIMYPMIKDNTDYTLKCRQRPEDLSEEIDTYFAIN